MPAYHDKGNPVSNMVDPYEIMHLFNGKSDIKGSYRYDAVN